MGRIYFHTEHEGTVHVAGHERAHLGVQNRQVAMACIPDDRARVLAHVRPDHWLHTCGGGTWPAWLKTALGSFDDSVFVHQGQPVAMLDLVLNTVLAVGGDPMCLIARIDGQCELHAYVEGPNREWMADLIQTGLDRGLLRHTVGGTDRAGLPLVPWPVGWAEVIQLLRNRDDQPVVTSYAVTDWFPAERVAMMRDPADLDAYYGDDEDAEESGWGDLSSDEQWTRAMAGLRHHPDAKRDLSPENLRAPFGHCLTMFDLFGETKQVPAWVA
jgi:hypothetical protein